VNGRLASPVIESGAWVVFTAVLGATEKFKNLFSLLGTEPLFLGRRNYTSRNIALYTETVRLLKYHYIVDSF